MAGRPQRAMNLQIDISFLLLNNRFLDFLTHFPSRQQKSESSKVKSKGEISRSVLQVIRMSTRANRFSDVPFT